MQSKIMLKGMWLIMGMLLDLIEMSSCSTDAQIKGFRRRMDKWHTEAYNVVHTPPPDDAGEMEG